jgi:hypothetical protein
MNKWTLGQVGKTNPKRTQTNPVSKAKNAASYDTGDCHGKIFKKNSKWY